METTDESPIDGQATGAEITPASPRPFGRPFPPGVSPNPGGRPKDPIAGILRDLTGSGREVAEFLVAVIRDDVDGRIADKVGVLDRLDAQIDEQEAAAKCAHDDGDVFKEAQAKGAVASLRARAKAFRTRLARKRKIPVPVKVRVAAAQIFFDRAFGKPRETIDLALGNPDGSPLGSNPAMPAPGALSSLTTGDLAEIGAVLERATKRLLEAAPIEVEPSTIDPTSNATG